MEAQWLDQLHSLAVNVSTALATFFFLLLKY